MEEYLAEIRFFAGTYAPKNWMFCEGQIISINEYQELYSLIGTAYGGDGRTSFALPDFRSRVCVGPDYQQMNIGMRGGQETVVLQTENLPAHNHLIHVTEEPGDIASPENTVLTIPTGSFPDGRNVIPVTSSSFSDKYQGLVTLQDNSISVTGSNVPHNNIQPYIGTHFIICINGLYPQRN